MIDQPQEQSEAIDLKELIKKSFSLFGDNNIKLVVFLQGSILKLQKKKKFFVCYFTFYNIKDKQ